MRKLLLVVALVSACSPQQAPIPPAGVSTDTADMIFDSMSLNQTRGGVLAARVYADSAWYYNSTASADLRRMRVTFMDSTGKIQSVITARRGVLRTNSNDQVLDAYDSVVATTPGPRFDTLRTQHLLWNKLSNVIESDSAFTHKAPGSSTRGTGFTSNTSFTEMRVGKPVTRELPAAKSSAKKPPAKVKQP